MEKEKYQCTNCGCFFDTPKEIRTNWGSYYGVDSPENNIPLILSVCPDCESEGYEEVFEDEEEDD